MKEVKTHDLGSWSMFLAAHRARSPRRRGRVNRDRVLVYAPDPELRLWIEHELFGERVTSQIVDSLGDVATTLTLVPPPWPQLLIVDVTAISSGDVETLRAVRESGWSGVVIAIGEPSETLHRALGIDLALPATRTPEALRTAMKHVGVERPTVPLRRLAR